MVYDSVIMKEKITIEQNDRLRLKYPGNSVFVEHCTTLKECYERTEEGECLKGIVLEVIRKNGIFQITIHNGFEIIFLQTRNIIIASCGRITGNEVISLYEVLWAAGIQIDGTNLLPLRTVHNATSIDGITYEESKKVG